MKLFIYNSQTKKKEELISLSPKEIKMYVCGPTVYGFLHVGNFRGPVFFHLVYRWLEEKGYKVTYVFNFTDIDDKIIERASKEKISTSLLSEKYIQAFKEDYKSLKIKTPTHMPKVSDFMHEIIQFISSLIQKGNAYHKKGNVYFDVLSYKNYGTLSHRKIEDLIESESVEEKKHKKHPTDFALWKKSKPNEPFWDSPWGKGRPGWHIECSTMARSLLGDRLDIHGGGIDLLFPHHENEKAQSEALTGKVFVRYWMHNNMLEMKKQKMSKSLGNIQTYRDFLKTYSAEVFKFFVLSVHYRSVLDFSPPQINQSLLPLARIYSSLAFAKKEINFAIDFFKLKKKDSLEKFFAANNFDLKEKKTEAFLKYLMEKDLEIEKSFCDDFNTPQVMARIFEIVKFYNSLLRVSLKNKKPKKIEEEKKEIFKRWKISSSFIQWIQKWGKHMSLFQEPPQEFLIYMDDLLLKRKGLKREDIQKKVLQRIKARKEKNYSLSDQIREELRLIGISLQDLKDGGTDWEVLKNT